MFKTVLNAKKNINERLTAMQSNVIQADTKKPT